MITHLKVIKMRTFCDRFWGVKKYKILLTPLYFPKCKAVHTFGVRESLHLLWITRTGKLLRFDRSVPPNRIRCCTSAAGVIEISGAQKLPSYPLGHQFRLSGQALVETAFVLPVLFLLLFGFLQLAIALHAQQKLTYAVQQATQVGALTNNDLKITGVVETYYEVDEVLIELTNRNNTTNTEINSIDRRYSDLLQVKLVQPYAFNVPFWTVPVFNLTAQASSRVLCNESNPPYQCD